MMSKKIYFLNLFPLLLCAPLHLFFVHKLEELGYEVEIVDRIGDDDALYFITFVHLHNLPKNYILYNFEYGDNYLKNARNITLYNAAIEVWDYSTRNIDRMDLTTKHVFVPYLPGDYPDIVEKMNAFVSVDKTHEYLFYGGMNENRRRALDSFRAIMDVEHVYEVGGHHAPTVFGEAMFAILGKSKFVINVHANPDPVMEIYRIAECQLLGVHVISEDGFMDDIYKSKLTNLTIMDMNRS